MSVCAGAYVKISLPSQLAVINNNNHKSGEQWPCQHGPLSMADKVTAHIRASCFDKCYISTSGTG